VEGRGWVGVKGPFDYCGSCALAFPLGIALFGRIAALRGERSVSAYG